MKISIVTPSYNQAKYLPATLESLYKQDYANVEFLVYDGGSTDQSVEILRSQSDPRLRWVSARDKGQTDAINQGLAASGGDILAYLNSDDIYYPGVLSLVADYFQAHPECAVVYGDAHHLYEDGSVMEDYYTESWNYGRLLKVCYICQPSVFWRRSVIERFGVFDETLNFGMDYEYWLRLGKHIDFHYLKGCYLAGSRLHSDTKTLSKRMDVHREILRVVKRHTDNIEAVEHWFRHMNHYESLRGATKVPSMQAFSRRHASRYLSSSLTNASRERILISETLLAELEAVLRDVGGAK